MIELWLAGCWSPDHDEDEEDSAGEELRPIADERIELGDENNYVFSATLDAPSFQVKQNADVSLDWSALDADLQCHDLDPVADVDNVSLLGFPLLDEATIEAGVIEDTLQQADLGVYLSWEPGDATAVSLSQFTFFGTDPDIEPEFTEGSGTWMVLLTTGTTVGVGARMLAFLEPRADADTLSVAVDDGCAVLDYTVELETMETAPVLEMGPWELDWSAVTATGQGTPFDRNKVSGVMVAWFAELALTELENQFLDLELLADGLWSLDHSGGTTADLSMLAAADGSPFPGFSAPGTWLVALRCSTCRSPAPLVLAALER